MTKYSFIIPTKDLKKLKNFKLPLDSELIPVVGAVSFFDAWRKGIKKAKGKYLVLTHDDTEYIEFPDMDEYFKIKTDNKGNLIEKKPVGMVGTAGTTVLHKDQPWWFSQERYLGGILSGQIWNGKEHSVFGEFGEVVALDGVCLVIKKFDLDSMFKLKALDKDYGTWDFYDQILSMEMFIRGFKLLTVPMKINHASKGADKRPSFFDSLDKFKADYLDKTWRIK